MDMATGVERGVTLHCCSRLMPLHLTALLVSEPSVETSAAARDGEVVTVTGQLVPRCILQHANTKQP